MTVENTREKRAIGAEAVTKDVERIQKRKWNQQEKNEKIIKVLDWLKIPVEAWKCIAIIEV